MVDKLKDLFERPGVEVRLDEIHKSYQVGDQRYPVLKGISCRMTPGTVTIIQGASGSGKSTLLNLIAGIDNPDSGAITTGDCTLDVSWTERALSAYRLNMIGVVFQAFNLVPGLSAYQNIRLPLTLAHWPRDTQFPRAEALLTLVELAGKVEKRPDALSGGEQQRVAVAVALANDPAVILADEPTGSLDSVNAGRVADLLSSLAHTLGKTVVIATHDAAIAERGDQVLQMQDGRIVG